MSWAHSLTAEPATRAELLSSGEPGSSKEGKDKGIISAASGAWKLLKLISSCAPGETKDSFASKRISELEDTAVKSEIEVFKSSLAFDGETGGKSGIQADQFGLKMS